MNTHRPLTIIVVLGCVALQPTYPQEAAQIPAEASRRLHYVLGDWDSEWEVLGRNGEVVRTMRGTESARWVLEGRMVELTTQVEGQPGPSKAWAFYNDVDRLYHLISVGSNGDLWTMSGGLDEYVITSPLVTRPNGTKMAIRFDHDESDPNVVKAQMYRRRDGDDDWQLATRQTMRRRHHHLAPQARQFDFWIGRWDVNLRMRQPDGTWPESSVAADAEIYSVLGGKAILELWDSNPIKGFSIRYFDPKRSRWVLWLNWPSAGRSGSSGLTGSFRHGRGEFFSERTNPDGTTTRSRYSFSDITPTSLRWDDAFSADGGLTWTNNWLMEFTRTEQAPQLSAAGGPGHTYSSGNRCAEPEFRRFEAIGGQRAGTAHWRDDNGEWQEAPAELTGHLVLDGCAVIASIATKRDGGSFETFHHLTWNTFAGAFEESYLDSDIETPLQVYYGQADDSADGSITVQRRPALGEEITDKRHRWSLEGGVTLEIEAPSADGSSWSPTVSYSFPD